jgi:hypothetical protein
MRNRDTRAKFWNVLQTTTWYVEYAIKFVGFGEMGDNKIIDSRGPEVRGGWGNCVMGNICYFLHNFIRLLSSKTVKRALNAKRIRMMSDA